MKSRLVRNVFRAAPLAALLLAAAARPAAAAEYWLRAGSFVKTMPDGAAVTMWGYAPCGAAFTGCGPATAPGPALAVPAGEALTVHLSNPALPEAVSITIPGQPPPAGSAVVRNPDGRIRAFTHEAAPGGTADYVWPAGAIRAGTYLYQSGSHPAVQVQMGLYGALESDASPANAYGAPDPAYDADLTILLAEVDPALHAAVAAGKYGPGLAVSSTMDYEPRYFLVNGQSFSPGQSPVDLGAPGQRLHLRLLNAGLKTRLPAFAGLPLELIAEDGRRTAAGQEPEAGQVMLAAGQTRDAVLLVPGPGHFPVYDRAMGLVSGTAPGSGMLLALRVADPVQRTLTVTRTGGGAGTVRTASLPGGIECGTDCTEAFNDGTGVTLVATPNRGSYFHGWSGACTGRGDCVTTMSAARTATAEFRPATTVRVINPNGGETLTEGGFFTVRWEIPSNARHVTLHYTTNGGSTWKLLDRGVTGNNLVWRVPQVASTRTNCRVRVRAFNASNVQIGSDTSDANFTITNVP